MNFHVVDCTCMHIWWLRILEEVLLFWIGTYTIVRNPVYIDPQVAIVNRLIIEEYSRIPGLSFKANRMHQQTKNELSEDIFLNNIFLGLLTDIKKSTHGPDS